MSRKTECVGSCRGRAWKAYGLPAVLLLSWISSRWASATTVLPISDQELFRRADVVVHGVVISNDVTVDELGRPETLTVIEPSSVVKGRLAGPLVLHQLGGVLPDGRALQLWGRPEYAVGGEVVVFAIRRPEGEFQTAEMMLGKFGVFEDSAGARFAIPELVTSAQRGVEVRDAAGVRKNTGAARRDPLEGAGDDSLSSLDGPRELTRFLEALVLGESTRPSKATPSGSLKAVEHKDAARGRSPQWGNISNQLWRWNNNATAAWTLVNSANMTGGGTSEATAALAAWTNEPNSNINYTVGSGTSSQIDLNAASSSGCGWSTCFTGSGVIGCGGPSGGGSNSWRSESYITITQGFVQVRSLCSMNGLSSTVFQSVIMHELGHTLGLGHSDQNVSSHDVCRGDEDAATMRSIVQSRTTLGTDDTDAVRWIYGDGLNSCSPQGPPSVSAISPTFGPTGGGTQVTISGSNFVSGATVSLGGVAATGVSFVNSTTLTATAGAHSAGSVNVVVTNPDTQTGTLTNGYTYNSGTGFYTVTPCRLVDTRGTNAPALSAGADRSFAVTSQCGVPSSARAVAVNLTIVGPTASGFLTAYPAGAPLPAVSAINFQSGQTRANNAILPLGAAGNLMVHSGQSSGTVQFVLDVNGYYQ